MNKPNIKQKIQRVISSRFAVRWHMTLIITASFLAGLITTKLLLAAGNSAMMFRYPFSVLIAYLTFLWGVWLWLAYAGYAHHFVRKHHSYIDGGNFPDIPNITSDVMPRVDAFSCHGGDFGGGGASGSWDTPGLEFTPDGGGDISGGAAEVVGGAAGEGGCFVVLIGLSLLAIVFGIGIYFIYEAPVILAEAVFEALLAGGLIRVAKRMRYDASWSDGVIKKTWPAFILVLLGSFLFAWAASYYAPETKDLPEVIAKIKLQHGKS
jgi:hypothetical protein